MDKANYNKIRAAVAGATGLLMAFSVIRETYALAAITVILGMAVLFVAKSNVKQVIYDERDVIVRQKAATATVSIVTVGISLSGYGIVALHNMGYTVPLDIGYLLAYLGILIMGLNAFFTWYYQNQLGG